MQKKILFLSIAFNILMVGIGGKLFFDKGGFNRFAPSTAISYVEGRTQTFNEMEVGPDSTVFLGDSLTEGGEWSEVFQDPTLVNRGINGDSTAGILGRVERTVDGHPKRLFLMAGINDLEHKVSKDVILKNYEEILQKVDAVSPETQVYVQSVLPNNKNIRPTSVPTSQIEELNENLRSLAAEYDAEYIDLFAFMVDSDGNLREEYTYDGVHLKAEGYQKWIGQIESYVKQ